MLPAAALRRPPPAGAMSSSVANPYAAWSREQLIHRLLELDRSSPDARSPPSPAPCPPPPPPPPPPTPAPPAKLTLRKARAQDPLARTTKSTPALAHLPLRKVALKLSYLGAPYCGLAIQPDSPLPTVEGVLLAALEKSGLVPAGEGWEGCGFSRCGRTDRGVSAAGQVVSLWVRSRVEYDDQVHAPRRPEPGEGRAAEDEAFDPRAPRYWSPPASAAPPSRRSAPPPASDGAADGDELAPSTTPFAQKPRAKPTEFPYVSLLNRLLPPTIRILAWSPLAPSSAKDAFDARHSCTHRHYKYFFTLASAPSPDSAARKPLDLAAMRKAASYLEGEHDFRNLCKVDGSKQIQTHVRRIYKAEISAVPAVSGVPLQLSPWSHISPEHLEPSGPPAPAPADDEGSYYVLDLLGRAFLYHQVRHIMAVLFLVGAGLERPEVVLDLFEYDGKPAYEMASDQPLVLWDCGFPEGALQWQYGPLPPTPPSPAVAAAEAAAAAPEHLPGAHAQDDAAKTAGQLTSQLATAVQASHLTTLLHAHFLSSFLALHPSIPAAPNPARAAAAAATAPAAGKGKQQLSVFATPLGANTFNIQTLPAFPQLAQRAQGEPPEVANRAWRVRMESKGRGLKLVGGGKVVRIDERDREAGRVLNGVRWVEPDGKEDESRVAQGDE